MEASKSTETDVLPLDGITVVDLTQVAAGPFATMALGDLGAEVIKIEAVGRGDRSRDIQPTPAYFDTLNRNKVQRRHRPQERRGAGSGSAARRRRRRVHREHETGTRRVVRTRIRDRGRAESGAHLLFDLRFGRDSPYEDLPAWDMLIQGMSGIMSITGEEGGEPLWSGLPAAISSPVRMLQPARVFSPRCTLESEAASTASGSKFPC